MTATHILIYDEQNPSPKFKSTYLKYMKYLRLDF